MQIVTKPLLALTGASMLFVAGCAEMNQDDGYRNTRTGAGTGALLGAALGAIVSDDKAKGAAIGAVAGGAAGAIYGSVLDKQEAELRGQLGDDVMITNTGDRLIVTMPQDILFATDSATLRPDLTTDLRTVARSLNKYPDTTVQVIGHTDNTGEASYNQQLSARRANSVADILVSSGVSSSRVVAFGRGEDQPRASNLTPEGRAQNRRVDIVILPNS
ncbi:OmpA family protein [Pseudooceanicola nanhaiensis]|uniref:OmpA family protein n=1 Tax=Pseudooceanicola nanhaiensis TaxID=375761 RepID=UPI001CD7C7A3|nr:OmpA family protein [Pseudooceanicola nanhaiensis]MCA0921201.1 OmpA family protein [Pseudooceanicola nanhaiensis]